MMVNEELELERMDSDWFGVLFQVLIEVTEEKNMKNHRLASLCAEI
jgi:hypothetical protein